MVDELDERPEFAGEEETALRVTPADQIDIDYRRAGGTANKTLLAWAKKHAIASVGLYLGDGDSVNADPARRRTGACWHWRSRVYLLINTLAGRRFPAGCDLSG